MDTWFAAVAAVAAIAGLLYQRHASKKERLEEIADLLADLHNVVVGQTPTLGQPTAKARLRTRLGQGDDLPKTRQVLDTPLSIFEDENIPLVEAAQTEVAAALARRFLV